MKKKMLAVFAALLVVVGIGFSFGGHQVDASYGKAEIYTTPKSVRGVWYCKGNGSVVVGRNTKKTYKLNITAHKINGKTLYKMSNKYDKQFWGKKTTWKTRRAAFKATKNWLEGYNTKKNGIKSMGVIGWLSGAGSGDEFTPVTRTVNGKKVKALRLSVGVDHTMGYAYKNKALLN